MSASTLEQAFHDAGIAPLASLPSELRIGGETLLLTPGDLLELAEMYVHARPAFEKMQNAPEGASLNDGLMLAMTDADAVRGLLHAAAVGSRKPLEWVTALEGNDQIELVATVLEVNADFFTRRVMPRMARVLATWMTSAISASRTSSRSSTTTATPTAGATPCAGPGGIWARLRAAISGKSVH